MTEVSIALPQDVVETLDDFAPFLGFSGHESLIRAFISEGMSKYEPQVEEKMQQAVVDRSGEVVRQAS